MTHHRGIMRVRLDLARGSVRARAYSQSLRGTPFVVGSSTVKPSSLDKTAVKAACEQALKEVLPPAV
jgi:hypothetical protein